MPNEDIFRYNEFYRTDIEILRDLGCDVVLARRRSEIPRNVDLHFVWFWNWALLPILSASWRRAPVVVTGILDLAAPSMLRPREWIRSFAKGLAFRMSSANLLSSADELRRLPSRLRGYRERYIPLAVDELRYPYHDGHREDLVVSVCWLGRHNIRRKRMFEVVEAAAKVTARRPGARFVIVGDTSADGYPELRSFARRLGVERVVEFPGAIDHDAKVALLRRASVYLQPTSFEGFGLAIAEAMSMGLPVVTSPRGEVQNVVGDAAVLVDGADVEQIARATIDLLSDPDRGRALGRRAHDRIRSHFGVPRRREGIREVLNGLGFSV